jgi:tRNA (Thr-GGU) A37 N-methylase
VLVCVDPAYRTGLQGIGGHSHIVVYWWALDNDTEAMRQLTFVNLRGLPRVTQAGLKRLAKNKTLQIRR